MDRDFARVVAGIGRHSRDRDQGWPGAHFTLDGDGKTTTVWTGAETLARGGFVPYVSLARDGKTSAVVRESFAKPPEVWAGAIGDWKQITHVNASLKPEWGEAKSLQWTTDIGAVQGWLIYPKQF